MGRTVRCWSRGPATRARIFASPLARRSAREEGLRRRRSGGPAPAVGIAAYLNVDQFAVVNPVSVSSPSGSAPPSISSPSRSPQDPGGPGA